MFTAFVVLFYVCSIIAPLSYAKEREDRLAAQRAMPIQSNEILNWPSGPVVNAEAALLMEVETGTILYAKNIDWKEYPASTTKLLTCLIAMERCEMDEMVTMSKDAINSTPYDSSHIAMDIGEAITMEQALHAILIRSANEVAFAVGEHIAGSWAAFADVMNERAAELGCTNSHFVNPNGLPDDNHYTTAYDMALIAKAFFANEMLCKISSTLRLHIPASDTQPQDILEVSNNRLLPGKDYAYENLVGSKTGYTNAARNCLVSCALKDSMKLICVVFKDESPLQFEDTIALFEYGFDNFEMITVADHETKYEIDNTGFFYSETSIFGDSNPILTLNLDDRIVLPKTIRFEDIQSKITYENLRENQGAKINYFFDTVPIGSASVDWAQNGVVFEFEQPADSEDLGPANSPSARISDASDISKVASGAQDANQTTAPNAPAVVFVNVVKIAIGCFMVAIILFILAIIRVVFKNYAFNPKGKLSFINRRTKHRHSIPQYEDLRAKHKEQIRVAKKRCKRTRR
ncbi:MAG: D-alanyl-D-alanine carboxypeptidase [Clostridium sp.]|nr:D-alanyl-D-alanine carboxypeptidase [Clostridium sp.]